jgi:hypothetical protein
MPTIDAPPTTPQARAFPGLERALMRRRLRSLDPRLRGEVALLVLMIAGFLFWQVRVPLDGLVRAQGVRAGVTAIAAGWLVLAALGAALVGIEHARKLRAGPAGPEWLALPLEPRALERHLAWDSRSLTAWLAVPALAILVAAQGLLPAWWLVAFAIVFVGLLVAAGHVGAALGYRAALRSVDARP